jgi:4'-phosphopantetheinyl transferase
MRRDVATVWWGELGRGDADSLEALLSHDERERAATFRFPRDRSRYVSARGLLRVLLADRLGLDPARIEFAYGEHGKPRLARADCDLRFNLSHSGSLMALAICEGREIGVDVEARRDDLIALGIARRYLPPRVVAVIERQAGPARADAFFRAWARQEAYAKGRGTGLESIGDDPEGWSIADLELRAGYAAALAIEGSAPVDVMTKPL